MGKNAFLMPCSYSDNGNPILDKEFMRNALVSRFDQLPLCYFKTLAELPKIKLKFTSKPVPSFLLDYAMKLTKPEGVYKPAKVSRDERFVRYITRSRRCVGDSSRIHRGNHVCLEFDTLKKMYRRRCFSSKCGHKTTAWICLNSKFQSRLSNEYEAEHLDTNIDSEDYIQLRMNTKFIEVPSDLRPREFKKYFSSVFDCPQMRISVLDKGCGEVRVTDGKHLVTFLYDKKNKRINTP
jgi:hypothetical protein